MLIFLISSSFTYPYASYQDEIFGSAYAAAVYLSSVVKLPKDKKVFVIGQTGLEEELRNEGVPFTGGTVSDLNTNTILLKSINFE